MRSVGQAQLTSSIVLGWALILTIGGCQDDQSIQDPPGRPLYTHRVSMAKVEKRTLPVVYPVPGTVVPKERLQVASRVTGIIERINVDEGDVVEAGAVLAEIDNAQIEAAISTAEALLSAASADLTDAGDDVKRFQKLAITQALALDRLRDAQVRQTQSEASVAQARAELAAARKERRYTRIISPARAQVRERLQDPGDLATAATPILQLDVLGPMELEIFLPSSRVGAVSVGQDVDVYLQSDDTPLQGKVDKIVYSADSVTRNCKIKIALPTDRRLTPGQFGRAHIVVGQASATLVPATAVTDRAGIEGVFVADKTGIVRFRSVRLGKPWREYREVLAGVDNGKSVVLNPSARLRDGDRVEITWPNGS
jgi:RND family efflux transporter MFP subunit